MELCPSACVGEMTRLRTPARVAATKSWTPTGRSSTWPRGSPAGYEQHALDILMTFTVHQHLAATWFHPVYVSLRCRCGSGRPRGCLTTCPTLSSVSTPSGSMASPLWLLQWSAQIDLPLGARRPSSLSSLTTAR